MAPNDSSSFSPVIVGGSADADGDLRSRFIEILQCPIPFSEKDPNEQDCCRHTLELLTEEEREQTAQVSYAYWYLATALSDDDDSDLKTITKQYRDHSSLKEIRRHYIGEDKDVDKTLVAIREAMAFRKQYQINELRELFVHNNNHENQHESDDANGDSSASTLARSQLEQLFEDDLKSQMLVVRGCNTHKSGIAYKFNREILTANTNSKGYLLANLYVAERLMAYTEFVSAGKQEKVIVAFDFSTYESQYKPPTDAMKIFTVMLQRLYPERLQT